MQRSSSGSKRTTAPPSRDGIHRVIENRIFISNAQTNLTQKLDEIKKQISKQYHNKFSTQRKQSVSHRQSASILNSSKVKRTLLHEENERFKEQYYQLKDQYLTDKKEFVQALEKYHNLRTTVESYFKNPLQGSCLARLKEFNLSQNVDDYLEFVAQLNRQNQQLKGHIERMLKIFQLHDFQDMIREMTELLDRSKQQASRNYEAELDQLRLELLESKRQIKEKTGDIMEQEEKNRNVQQDLKSKNLLLKEVQNRLDSEIKLKIECQGIIDNLKQEKQQYLQAINKLKSDGSEFNRSLKAMNESNEKLQKTIERQQTLLESQQKQNIDLSRKVLELEDNRNRLLGGLAQAQQKNELVQNRLNKMINDYDGSRAEWADQIRQKDSDITSLKQQLTYEKISINRVCDLLRVVEQDQISERIRSLLSTQIQHTSNQPLIQDFSRRIELLLSQSVHLREQITRLTSQRDQYKFLLTTLNADIENIKNEEKARAKESIQKCQTLSKEIHKKLNQEIQDCRDELKKVKEQILFYRKQGQVLLIRCEKITKELQLANQQLSKAKAQNIKLNEEMGGILISLKEIEELNGLTGNKLKLSEEEARGLRSRMEKSEADHTATYKQLQDQINKLSSEGLVLKEKLGLVESNLLVTKSQMAYKENDSKIIIEKLTTDIESKTALMQLSEQAFKRRLAQAQNRNIQASTEIANLKDCIAHLQRQILLKDQQLMDNNRKLKEQRNRFEKDIGRQTQKQQELEHQVQRLQIQIQEQSNEVKKLRRDKNDLSMKLMKQRSQDKIIIDQLQDQKQHLKQQLQAAKTKTVQVQSKKEIDQQEVKLQISSLNQKIRELQLALQSREKNLTQAQKTLAKWNAQHDETVIELAQAQAFIEQTQQALRDKETQLNLQRVKAKQILSQLELALSKHKKQESARDILKKSLQEFEREMQREKITLRTKEKHLFNSQKQLNQAKCKISNLVDQNQGYLKQIQIKDLQMKKLTSSIEKKEQTIKSLENTNKSLLRQINQAKIDIKTLQEQNNQLEKKLNENKVSLVKFDDDSINTSKETERIRHQMDDLLSKKFELLQKLKESQKIISELRVNNLDAITRCSKLQDQLADLEQEFDSLKVSYNQAREQIQKSEQKNTQSIKNTNFQQLSRRSQVEKDINQIKKSLVDEKNQNQIIMSELLQLKTKHEKMLKQKQSLQYGLAESQDQNQKLLEQLAQTSSLLEQVNKNLDQLKENQAKRVQTLLQGLIDSPETRELLYELPYWNEIQSLYTDILSKITQLKHSALDISAVEAPRTNRNLPSPSPSIGKQFVFQKQKTDPIVEDDQSGHSGQKQDYLQQLQKLTQQNDMFRKQIADSEKNQQNFMIIQGDLKEQMKQLQRKNAALQNNQNVQTMRTLKSLFMKLIDALPNNNQTDIQQCLRVISKLLDMPSNYRDQIQQNFDKKKKKKGFLGIFK